MIPVCEPTIGEKELEYVTDCLKTNWISSQGKYIEQFEQKFADFCGVKHGVACSNGTTALHLGLAAAGIGPGDEVIIPTFTMIATANAVSYTGAKPVLVDSELETWNMDVSLIEEKITDKTKAILPVHTYGHPIDMGPLKEIAEKHSLFVFEDAAEAHGAEYKGKRAGSLGDAAAFSFYGNKIITTGEGGMVVTDDGKLAEKMRLLRNHAFTKPRFHHKEIGFNYRMTNIQAAIGVAQMERADELVEARIRNAKKYNKLLAGADVTLPPQAEWAKNVYWMYGVLLGDEYGGVPESMGKLKAKGVDTRAFFYPMHKQELYQKKDSRFPDVSGSYPIAEKLSDRGLYLPSSSSLTDEQIATVAEALISLK